MLIMLSIVALAVVFHVPYAIMTEIVMLKSWSFRESCVTLKSGFAISDRENRPKAVLNWLLSMMVPLMTEGMSVG